MTPANRFAQTARNLQLRKALLVLLAVGVPLVVFVGLFGRFFPTVQGRMGHDFGLFLPRLLEGYYWYLVNGSFSIPWFLPGQCGGLPGFADPQQVYFSLPQWLSFVVDPVRASFYSLVIMSAIGALGAFRLLRDVFAVSVPAAWFGAVAFAFNGFVVHRAIIGHIVFEGFALLPAIAWWLLRPLDARAAKRQVVSNGLLAGAAVSYCLYSGMVNLMLPLLLGLLVLLLMAMFRAPLRRDQWQRLLIGAGFAPALAAAKLVAGFHYLAEFSRSEYPLPGAGDFLDAFRLILRSIFIAPAHEEAATLFQNGIWGLDRHEFEYGVGWVFLPIFAAWFVRAVCSFDGARARRWWTRRKLGLVMVIVLILLIPVFVNTYAPAWNAFLKSLPVIKNSSTLI